MAEEKKIPYKIYLTEDEMPRDWYNVRADMVKKPAPLLNPGTHLLVGFDQIIDGIKRRYQKVDRRIERVDIRFGILQGGFYLIGELFL